METAENSIYRKLQLHLDKYPIGYPATDSGVELEILRLFFTEDEAKIALSLSLLTLPYGEFTVDTKNYLGIQ
jgi:hypothetical protein